MAMEQSLTDRISAARRTQGFLSLQQSFDLLIVCLLALLAPVLLTLPFALLRVPLGLGVVLVLPGYALMAALFPRRTDLDGAVRAALSVGLSAAIVPLLAITLNVLPWGIHPWPIAIALVIWILAFCGVALRRRRTFISADLVPSSVGTLRQPHSLWKEGKGIVAIGSLFFAGLLLLGVIYLLIIEPASYATEFYILGAEGQAEKYPRQVALGQPATIALGIANQEINEQLYRVEVWAVDARNTDRQALIAQIGPIKLSPGQRLERSVTWRMPWVGDDQEVRLLLFTGTISEPYRQLRLWLNVTNDPETP
jgi:uncharacterized membrane protein